MKALFISSRSLKTITRARMVQILNTETMIHLTVYQEYSEGRFREKCLTHPTCSCDWKMFNIVDIYYPHDKGPIYFI